MAKFQNSKLIVKLLLVASCLATLIDSKSDAFLLNNIIGCNSFGCRLTALETEVNQLKMQVNRLQTDRSNNNNNNQGNNGLNDNQGYNNPLNQGGGGGGLNNNNNNQGVTNSPATNTNQGTNQPANSANMIRNELNRVYGNLGDYGQQQQQQQPLRRINNGGNIGYQNSALNNQFFRGA